MTISKLAAGGASSYAISSTGDLYSWGSDMYGHLSFGRALNRLSPPASSSLVGYQLPNWAKHFVVARAWNLTGLEFFFSRSLSLQIAWWFKPIFLISGFLIFDFAANSAQARTASATRSSTRLPVPIPNCSATRTRSSREMPIYLPLVWMRKRTVSVYWPIFDKPANAFQSQVEVSWPQVWPQNRGKTVTLEDMSDLKKPLRDSIYVFEVKEWQHRNASPRSSHSEGQGFESPQLHQVSRRRRENYVRVSVNLSESTAYWVRSWENQAKSEQSITSLFCGARSSVMKRQACKHALSGRHLCGLESACFWVNGTSWPERSKRQKTRTWCHTIWSASKSHAAQRVCLPRQSRRTHGTHVNCSV